MLAGFDDTASLLISGTTVITLSLLAVGVLLGVVIFLVMLGE